MTAIQALINEFRELMKAGRVPAAYRALLGYLLNLRTHFKNGYPRYAVSGLYQGYMDMTYFAIFPPSLKTRELKIAIVFTYETFRFEAWLAGKNRKVQRQYWELFRDSHWPEYRVVKPAKGVDAILECILAEDFDLRDPDALTATIERGTAAFIADLEKFLTVA